jgi:hypothetical protein
VLELLLQGCVERVLDQTLRHPDPAGRQRSQLGGDLGSACREAVALDHLRHETPGVRLGGGQPSPGRKPLEGARRPEDSRHEVGTARIRDQTDVDERRYERGGLRRDPEIAHARKGEPCTGGRSVHRRDHRLLESADRKDVGVIRLVQASPDVAGRLTEFRQILSDTEGSAGAREDDGAHFGIPRLLERRRERAVRVGVQGVEDVRPVERDGEDSPVSARLDLGHGRTLADRRSTERRC